MCVCMSARIYLCYNIHMCVRERGRGNGREGVGEREGEGVGVGEYQVRSLPHQSPLVK